ncbi:MAG: Pachytene checkpoint protein 2 [Claussenomyces sp. TS43310]|nr:MAG: Pachytene checkpoint protein 2 [Claussenomyces sp. TS43310]
MVKFSRRRGQEERSSLSRLILLYGPPGTGKTSLALGLAQKASIRLIHEFGTLKLIQIDTSTIFSKWLGESAHKVKEIFSNIIEMCRNSPQHFTCVILDEIESLASSRAESSARMEVHDTVRATNALLQAFDTMLSQNNIIVIATSNLQELLDDAFLSRCDYSFFIDLPSAKARYEIMRGSLQTLISRGIIQTEEAIPYYDDILQTVNSQPDQLGSNVLRLAQSLAGQDCRILSKLAEAALIEQMVADTCSLSEALRFISKSLEEHRSSRFLKRRLSESIQKAKAGQDLVKSRVSRRQRMKLDDSQFVDRAAGNRTTSQDSIGRLFDSKVEFETDITSISSEEGSL